MLQRLNGIEAGWKLFWIFLLLYCAFPSARYYWDGVEYAQLAERAVDWRELLHPHHLFYNLLVMWVSRFVVEPLGLAWPGLVAQEWLNGLLGAFCVMFLYRTLRYFVLDPLAWQVAGIGGAAYTFWSYAGDHAPYIPAVFRIVLVFHVIVMALKDPLWEPKRLYMQAINVFLMVMLHQAAVFFVLPYLYYLWHRTRDLDDPAYWRVATLTFSVGLIGFHYLLFGFATLELATPAAFWQWATSYGHDSRWWYAMQQEPGSSDLAFLGTYAAAVWKSHVATFLYPDYLYHGFLSWPSGGGGALLLDLVKKALLGLTLWHGGIAALGGFQHLGLFFELQHRVLRWVLIGWVLLFFMFFLFFQPQMAFYRLFYFIPMLLVLAIGLDRGFGIGSRRLTASAGVLLAALGIYNFGAGILPAHNPAKNPWLVEAQKLVPAIPPRTVILLPGGPNYSVLDTTFGTRTWELVEYLGGVLPGPERANAIEVVYFSPSDPEATPIDIEALLTPSGMTPYERVWIWAGLEQPDPAFGYFALEDRTFAHKPLRPALGRWDTTIILPPSDTVFALEGQWFIEFAP